MLQMCFSRVIIKLLLKKYSQKILSYSEEANILEDIQTSRKTLQAIQFDFVSGRANIVAHRLAALALESKTNQVYMDRPDQILEALQFDCNHFP